MSHSLHNSFSKMLQFVPKNLQHTQKKMNKMGLSAVNFVRTSWSKSFNNGIIYNRDGFKCICLTVSGQYTELFCKLFTKATEPGRSKGGCKFGKILYPTHQSNKMSRRESLWFLTKKFEVVRILLSGTWSLFFHYGYCWSHEQSYSRTTQSQRILYHC